MSLLLAVVSILYKYISTTFWGNPCLFLVKSRSLYYTSDGAMTHQFCLTLPSESCGNIFPDKTTACFKTKSSGGIEREGQYEVGLAQLIYLRSWYNFDDKNRSLLITYQPDYNDVDGKHMPEMKMSKVFVSGQFANEKTVAMVLGFS
jgi:hypothetical protein